MGYRKIPNLYKPEASLAVLSQKEVYALEKIHGTSAHVKFTPEPKECEEKWSGFRADRDPRFTYFPGGIKEDNFLEMLDAKFIYGEMGKGMGLLSLEDSIRKHAAFIYKGELEELTLFGEAYGGKCQKMRGIYGDLNFVVFEVKVKLKDQDAFWLTVPAAESLATRVGFEFVPWTKGPATLEFLDAERDKPSQQARRNGMGDAHTGEGIVIRMINEELKDTRGNRIVVKHKTEKFRETKTKREVNPELQKIWAAAKETAEEFVVMERLNHVVDKLKATKPGFELDLKNTRTVIGAMIGDVRKEEGDTIEWSSTIQKAIGARTAKMWRTYLEEQIHEEDSKVE